MKLFDSIDIDDEFLEIDFYVLYFKNIILILNDVYLD
jgi:hypothetical protein